MRFTIKARLAAAFAAILILSAVSAYLGVSSLGSVNDEVKAIVNGPATRTVMTLHMANVLSMAARTEKNLILESDEQAMKGYVERLKGERKKFQELFEHRRQVATEEGKKALDTLHAVYEEYNKSQDETVQLALLNSNTKANALSEGAAKTAFDNALKIIMEIKPDGADQQAAADISAIAYVMLRINRNEKEMIRREDAREDHSQSGTLPGSPDQTDGAARPWLGGAARRSPALHRRLGCVHSGASASRSPGAGKRQQPGLGPLLRQEP